MSGGAGSGSPPEFDSKLGEESGEDSGGEILEGLELPNVADEIGAEVI